MESNVTENNKTETITIIFVFLIMILANVGLNKLINILFSKGIDIPIIVYGTLIEVFIMIPVIVYIKMMGENLLESLGFHKVKITTILFTILLTLLSIPLYMCANIFSQLFVPNTMIQLSQLFSVSLLSTWFIMSMLHLFVKRSFRGFCFKRFRRITSLIIAVLVQLQYWESFILVQICYAIVLGVVFSLANFASGSIWTSITMHFIVNNIGFLFLAKVNSLADASGKSLAEDAENFRKDRNTILSIGIILLIILIGFLFLIKKVLRKIAQNENNQEAIEFFGNKKDKEFA